MERINDADNLAKILVEQVGNGNKGQVVPIKKMEIGDVELPNDKSGPDAAIKAAGINKLEDGPAVNHTQSMPKPINNKTNIKEGVKNMIPRSSFDELFKNTINEQDEMIDDADDMEDMDTSSDLDVEDNGDDVGEEVDVATRLEMIIDDLSSIVSAIRGESDEESVEDFDDETVDDDFGGEDDIENGIGEAVSQPEPKEFGDGGGKKMMGKGNIKVGGTLNKATASKGNIGRLTNSPEPKNFPDSGKKLASKSNIKVKSPGIKQGNPIHT